MRQIPGFLMRHKVVVEPFQGTNAVGEVFSAGKEISCMFGEKNQMVRNSQGEEVSSSSFYITTPDHAPPENSRVTIKHTGRTARVRAWDRPTWPGMDVPANTKVYLD